MPLARKIVLIAPPWASPRLRNFVEECLESGVALICVIGEDCERVHDVIDELLVGDRSRDPKCFPATSWHTGEARDAVMRFAEDWVVDGDQNATVEEISLS